MKKLVFVPSLAILLACGGGGGGSSSSNSSTPATNAVFEGPWTGTLYTSQGATSSHALVLANGTIRVADALGVEAVGSISGTAASCQCSGTEYAPTGDVFLSSRSVTAPFSMTGSGTAGNNFSGSYTGADSGTYFFTYDSAASYTTPVVMGNVAGSYSSTTSTDGYQITATLTSSGSFSGNETSGATFSGTVSAVDPSKNAFNVTWTLTQGSTVIQYSGLAYFDFGGNITLNVQGTSSMGGFAASLQRTGS